jgi:hypothetical protein
MHRSEVTSAALVVLLAAPWSALAAQKKNPCASNDTTVWKFTVTPIAWATGIKGDVGARGQTARISLTFDQVLKHLDGVFMLPMELTKGRFGVGAEVIYTKLSDDRATAGILFTGADADVKQWIVTLAPRIRVASTKRVQADVVFGARLWSLDNSITLHRVAGPDLEFGQKNTWVDAVAGGRVFYKVADRWLVQARGDVGGFGSLLSWQAIGLVDYRANSRITLRAGYRQLDVDFHERGGGLIYDVGLGGPIVGVSIRFK